MSKILFTLLFLIYIGNVNSRTLYATYLFPNELIKAYEPLKDPTYPYYKNLPQLSTRKVRKDVFQTNLNQVMGLLNYSSRDGKNPKIIGSVSGDDRSIFEGWNYIDVYVSFSGDAESGTISLPTPQEIKIGHKNGVPVLGTILFPSWNYGGKVEWEKDFLAKNKHDKYLIVNKLENLAKLFHFDGWFISFQTGGLSKHNVKDIVNILKELKERNLNIVWDDELTINGFVIPQSELNIENKEFFDNASSLFTYYEWLPYSNLPVTLQNAQHRAKDVYMSIDWWKNNDTAFEKIQELISFNDKSQINSRQLSLGLWAIEFPLTGENVQSIDNLHDAFARKWWTSDLYKYVAGKKKNTFGDFITTKASITELPLITNFNLGKGLLYYRNGLPVDSHPNNWGNLAEQDFLVASVIHKENLQADYDFYNVFNGGSSYSIQCNGYYGEFPVYYSWIKHKETAIFDIVYKSNESILAYLKYSDGSRSIMHLNKSQDWSSQGFSVNVNKRTISEIGIIVNPKSDIRIGRIAMR